MNTSLRNREAQLLVDTETGKVLRGDDYPIITRRWAEAHPFIEVEGSTLFAGYEATRALQRRRRGEPITYLDVHEYEIHSEVAGSLRLKRVIDE